MVIYAQMAAGEYPVSSPEFKLMIWNPFTRRAVFVRR